MASYSQNQTSPEDESHYDMSLVNCEIDVLPNAILPFDIMNERTDVSPHDNLDNFHRDMESQLDADFVWREQDHSLGPEFENDGLGDELRANRLGPSITEISQGDAQVNSVALLCEYLTPEQAVDVSAVTNDIATSARGMKRQSSTALCPTRYAKRSQGVRACARCWIKKREVLDASPFKSRASPC